MGSKPDKDPIDSGSDSGASLSDLFSIFVH